LGVPFIIPIKPGATPIIPVASTGLQIACINETHKENVRMWKQYLSTDKALKQQLLSAIDEMYYHTLCNWHTGYDMVTTCQILNHLYTGYGDVSPQDMADNDACIKTAYDVLQPIEVLFDQVKDAIELANAAQAPYTPPQISAITFTLVSNTGIFHNTCCKWKCKPTIAQTWPNFKTDLAMAHHKELREHNTTSQAAGFGTANAAYPRDESIFTMHENTASALVNLATATASDHTIMSELTSLNSQLAMELTTANSKLATLTADVNALKISGQNGPASIGSGSQGDHNNRSTRDHPRRNRHYNNTNYCWNDLHEKHTSANCLYKQPGLKDAAMLADSMGGSQLNKGMVMRHASSVNDNHNAEFSHDTTHHTNEHYAIADSGTTGHLSTNE
jgi:hypothetical protein